MRNIIASMLIPGKHSLGLVEWMNLPSDRKIAILVSETGPPSLNALNLPKSSEYMMPLSTSMTGHLTTVLEVGVFRNLSLHQISRKTCE